MKVAPTDNLNKSGKRCHKHQIPVEDQIIIPASIINRSIRLKGYDYSQAGLYFITLTCQGRKHRFGRIENKEMILNEAGMVANNEWIKLPERYQNIEMDVFQIMPDHMHGIIALNDVVDETISFTPTTARALNHIDKYHGAIGRMIGAFKSLTTNGCLEVYKARNETMGQLWQRDYYEHIIRNIKEYRLIVDYIIDNPAKWNQTDN